MYACGVCELYPKKDKGKSLVRDNGFWREYVFNFAPIAVGGNKITDDNKILELLIHILYLSNFNTFYGRRYLLYDTLKYSNKECNDIYIFFMR